MPVDTTTSTEVPGRLPVAIAGHAYLIDPAEFSRQSVPAIREQADTSDEPGEHSLNPRGLWRRTQESWHHGAGQRFLDGRTSDRERFRASKGIDPWTEGQISLLAQTARFRDSTNTNLALVVVGRTGNSPYLVLADGDQVYAAQRPYNLLADNTAGIETSAAGWTAETNTTIARSTTHAAVGAASLKLTSVAAGDFSAISAATGTSGIPVVGNRRYSASAYVRKDAADTARNIRMEVLWYNSAGTLISTSGTGGAGLADSDLFTTQFTFTYVAPASAASAALRLVVIGATAANEDHYWDEIALSPDGQVAAAATWTSVDIHDTEGAQTVESITTNGTYLWAALGTSGIHRWVAGGTSVRNVPAGTFTLVGWALDRLLAANANVLYEILPQITAPVANSLHTHADTSFVWNVIAPGRNVIYAAGNASNQNATIYKITLEPTGTGLGAPSVATYLPDGETIHAIQFYAGAVILGTGKGIRIATADGQGNLDYGPLIETPKPVRCLEPQGRFCWFGWSDYDSSSTGLGRIDLGIFTEALVPAWASDLMAIPVPPATTIQGDVLSVVSHLPDAHLLAGKPFRRYFAVSGKGVYGEEITRLDYGLNYEPVPFRVASGTLESGAIRYSTTEKKTTRSLDVRHHVLDGTVTAELKMDHNAYASLGSSSTQGSTGPSSPLSTASAEGETAELRFTLSRPTDGRSCTASLTSGSTTLTSADAAFTSADVGRSIAILASNVPAGFRIASVTNSTTVVLNQSSPVTTSGTAFISSPALAPEMVRYMLKALPLPRREKIFSLPLLLTTYVDTMNGDGQPHYQAVQDEIDFLEGLEQAGTIVTLQFGAKNYSVYIDAIQQQGTHWGPDRSYLESRVAVRLQSVE